MDKKYQQVYIAKANEVRPYRTPIEYTARSIPELNCNTFPRTPLLVSTRSGNYGSPFGSAPFLTLKLSLCIGGRAAPRTPLLVFTAPDNHDSP